MEFLFNKRYSRVDALGITVFAVCITENSWEMALIGVGVAVFTIALTHTFGD